MKNIDDILDEFEGLAGVTLSLTDKYEVSSIEYVSNDLTTKAVIYLKSKDNEEEAIAVLDWVEGNEFNIIVATRNYMSKEDKEYIDSVLDYIKEAS